MNAGHKAKKVDFDYMSKYVNEVLEVDRQKKREDRSAVFTWPLFFEGGLKKYLVI